MPKRKYKGFQQCIYLDLDSKKKIKEIKEKLGENWSLSSFVRQELKDFHLC